MLPDGQHDNNKLISLAGDLNSFARGAGGGGVCVHLHAIPEGISATENCKMKHTPTGWIAVAVIWAEGQQCMRMQLVTRWMLRPDSMQQLHHECKLSDSLLHFESLVMRPRERGALQETLDQQSGEEKHHQQSLAKILLHRPL